MATTNTTREAVTPDSVLDGNRHDLLRWLNNLMKTSFTDVMQTNSGACLCQLMDWLFPGSVDVSRVRFQADGMDDYKHNFTLLQEAFRGRHVTKDIPVEELVSGDFKANLHFLKWFKAFFTENLDNQEYDVVAARGGQDIHPTGPVPNAQNQKIRKRDSVSDSTEDEACNHRLKKAQKIPYDPAWKDQCPWAEPSPKGEHSTYCSVCKLHLSTSHRGLHDIRRHEESTKHRTRSQKTHVGGTAIRETAMEEPPPPLACSAAAVRFILKHCYSGASALGERAARHYPRYMLGLRYPGDVARACKQTPYSLYVYGGLALGEDDSTAYCAVLAGYFDAKASRYVVRLLDVVEDGRGGGTAVADVVNRFDGTRAANLVAVYSQGQAPEASQRMCSALRDMNPHVVALAGLYEAADRAWRAAAAKLSLSQVQELLADLHAHHRYPPTPKDGPLTALFTSPDGTVRKTPPNLYHNNGGCLSDLCLVVGKLAQSWDELAADFESSREEDDDGASGAEAIRSRLQDVGLRATVMFLEHAMGPLHHFQKHLQSTKADLACVLEAAGSMLHTYAHRLLQPGAAARFLEGSLAGAGGLPGDKSSRLPAAELVGCAGGGPDLQFFLLKAGEGTMATEEALRKLAESFYEAVTRSLAESLPLRAAALKTMAQLLDPHRRLDVTSEAVRELGSTLGLCKSPGAACSLSVDFLEFQNNNAKRAEVQKRADGSAEQRWSAVLKDTESTSVLRKLLLALMSLPCPPLEARRLYDQAILNGDALLFSGREETETPGTTTGEEGEESDSISCTTSPHGRTNHSASPQRRRKTYPGVSDLVKTCEIRLTKIKSATNGSDDDRSGKDEGPVRGGSGRQSSLRQKPPARTLFQAGKENGREKDGGSGDSVKDTSGKSSTKGRGGRRSHAYQDGHDFQPAELVWGKLKLKKKWTWWPGMVMAWQKTSGPTMPGFRRVEWFGDGLYSEMHIYSLLPFSAFNKCFSKTDYGDVRLYTDAIYQIVELAAQRCAKSFGEVEGDKVKEPSFMLDWAMGGFLPSGPAGFNPPADSTGTDPVIDDSDSDFQAKTKDSDSDFRPMATDKTKDSDSDVQPMAPALGLQPTIAPAKRKYNVLSKSKNRTSVTYSREAMIQDVVKNRKKLEDFCLSCGAPETEVHHPLFEGNICLKCKENFIETLYRYDEADGYQSYCTVCCAGQKVVLCGIRSCCRCFCKDCLDILVRPGTFDLIELIDPWDCFMCDPEQCGGGGHLRRRDDWSTKVQQFFTNNSAMEFNPHRVYPSIPAQQRRPMKVLSLFDGIATGYLTLKQLGFKIDRYVASEICDDSIAVGMVRHEGKIEHVNDVRTITRKHLAEWGPFDVLIGGSPCNDLSMVNPLRKGLYEGTGRLFFEFYRILTILRPREDDDRPFFWLFENVVFMAANDKADIGRFLECNPIFIDAVKVSPAHRARYFWGNLPGMNRPLAASLDDKVNLQDCLENGRVAKFDKVRTITTKSNSIRQGKTGPLPVTMNDKEDYLWSTELEEIFGFPKHYTDVNNMGRSQRQRLLGRSWSVPVIRHLFAPLKDYFECQAGE